MVVKKENLYYIPDTAFVSFGIEKENNTIRMGSCGIKGNNRFKGYTKLLLNELLSDFKGYRFIALYVCVKETDLFLKKHYPDIKILYGVDNESELINTYEEFLNININ
jgi:hypothetical protein